MDAIEIIQKYYEPESKAYRLLVNHSRVVAKKAIDIAKRVRELSPDLTFIEEAAMLHDIGIFMTDMPKLGCSGIHPYISHGYLGREILEKEGLPVHALVCERHVGLGLTIQDIEKNGFHIPKRDMMPEGLEEKIICFADKFYSKDEHCLFIEKPLGRIRKMIAFYGSEKLLQFDEWLVLFREIDEAGLKRLSEDTGVKNNIQAGI